MHQIKLKFYLRLIGVLESALDWLVSKVKGEQLIKFRPEVVDFALGDGRQIKPCGEPRVSQEDLLIARKARHNFKYEASKRKP